MRLMIKLALYRKNGCMWIRKMKEEKNVYKTEGRDRKYKKWVISVVVMVMTTFLMLIGLVLYIDPFFQYHKPLEGFPYLIDNQLSQNPGIAKNWEYDSVILGSSMTVNFNTDWFSEILGLKTVKLSYNGAYPKDQSNIMEIIFRSKNHVKTVFLGIDIPAYSSDVNATKYPIPEYLYDENYLNDISYVLNKDVLLNYILRAVADPKDKTVIPTMYALWWTDEYFNKQYVLQYYEAPETVATEVPEDTYLEQVKINLDVNICPFIEAHPETEFVVFYPPYSILYWYGINRENKLNATLAEFQYVSERLLLYNNVRIFNFQNRKEIITDLNNYADYDHYHSDINRFMVNCFADGTSELTKENLSDNLEVMRVLAAEYDYDSIFEGAYD